VDATVVVSGAEVVVAELVEGVSDLVEPDPHAVSNASRARNPAA
jgi:hypothetical protein